MREGGYIDSVSFNLSPEWMFVLGRKQPYNSAIEDYSLMHVRAWCRPATGIKPRYYDLRPAQVIQSQAFCGYRRF